jgi:hypothetical protein
LAEIAGVAALKVERYATKPVLEIAGKKGRLLE